MTPEVETILTLSAKFGFGGLFVYFCFRAFNAAEKWFERAVIALEGIKTRVENMDDKLDGVIERVDRHGY